jgi:hypothetical protein
MQADYFPVQLDAMGAQFQFSTSEIKRFFMELLLLLYLSIINIREVLMGCGLKMIRRCWLFVPT